MKKEQHFYRLLLALYPRSYQRQFGPQMLQTFIDSLSDCERSDGRMIMYFWIFTFADEFKNIARQHFTPLENHDTFLRITGAKLAVAVVLLLPLFIAFYTALVSFAMILPHPSINGMGFLITFSTLCLLSFILSMMLGYTLASTSVRLFAKRKRRIYEAI